MSTTTSNDGPARGTQAYCITCNTYFKNTKGAMKHIVENYLHEAFYIDVMDPKSREAHLSMGLSQKIIDFIYKEQTKVR